MEEATKLIQNILAKMVKNPDLGITFDFLDLNLKLATWLNKNVKIDRKIVKNLSYSKMSCLDKINLLKEFASYAHLNIDIDEAISNGSIRIDFIEDYYDYFDISKKDEYFFANEGVTKYDSFNNIKLLNLSDTNSILDLSIWVHEISHYVDQPESARSSISDLLTESLAFYTQFTFMDFLRQKGYIEDANKMLLNELTVFSNCCNRNLHLLEVVTYYRDYGKVDEMSLVHYFHKDYDFNSINKDLSNIYNIRYFRTACEYILAAFLAPYLYRISKGEDCDDNFNQLLHNSINYSSLKRFSELTKINNLTDEEVISVFIDSFKELFKDELSLGELKK